MKQGRRAQKFIMHHWWTYVIWKNAELGAKHQTYKGRVVLRGDIVKDDSGSYAVFTEQGSSTSQMTAAKVMDIISRLPGCDGQAADAVSACTQVKMEDAHKLLKIPKSECPDIWIRLHRHNGLSHGPVSKTQSFSLERNLYGHPLAGLLWERQFVKILLKHGWEKVSNWKCLFVHRQKGLFLSVYVDDIKIGWKETKHWSDVENTQQRCRFGRTIFFPWSCLLGMHSKTMWNKQRSCGQLQNHVWIANFRGVNRKVSIPWESSYLFMVFWYGGSCKEMCGAILWVGKQDDSTTLQSIYSMHRWPSFQEEEMKSVGELSKVCSQIVLKCLYLARIGRPDILWSMNKLARSITNGSKPVINAWIDWIHIFITHVNTDSIAMWVILLNNADWDCFKTLTSQEILKIRNPLLEEHCACFWKSYICSNKLDVQETNFSFAQFNRTRNHLFGRWIEIGRDSPLSICGIWLFQSLETQFRPTIDRGNPLWTVTKITGQTSDL